MGKIEAEIRKKIEWRIKELKEAGTPSSALLEYYKYLNDYMHYGGKRLRPLTMIFAYKAVSGNDENAILDVCPSIEVLHNASLIHDDIIDRDELRRGKPTFHIIYSNWYKKRKNDSDAEHFGMSMGIVGGDSLINFAYRIIITSKFSVEQRLRALDALTTGFNELIDGEVMDVTFPLTEKVSEDEYFLMVDLKTSSLYAAAARMGAIFGGADDELINLFGKFMRLGGRAFQMKDDIIGLYGDPKVTGKPVGNDVREGKKTILVIKALENGTDEQKKTLLGMLGRHDLTDDDIAVARKIIEDTGALKYAEQKMDEFIRDAKATLDQMKPKLTEEGYNFFKEFVELFVKREK